MERPLPLQDLSIISRFVVARERFELSLTGSEPAVLTAILSGIIVVHPGFEPGISSLRGMRIRPAILMHHADIKKKWREVFGFGQILNI